jgi:hypothetical protein
MTDVTFLCASIEKDKGKYDNAIEVSQIKLSLNRFDLILLSDINKTY